MVGDAFVFGQFDPRLAKTLVTLIPKGDNASHLRNFRPISLCNVAYKVISKVLVNRLWPFLHGIISSLQRSFITNQGTSDDAIIAKEALHFMKKTKVKKGNKAFTIELENAYN